jgi:hypothetical protein
MHELGRSISRGREQARKFRRAAGLGSRFLPASPLSEHRDEPMEPEMRLEPTRRRLAMIDGDGHAGIFIARRGCVVVQRARPRFPGSARSSFISGAKSVPVL